MHAFAAFFIKRVHFLYKSVTIIIIMIYLRKEMICMSIAVYSLKNSIVQSSVQEYIDYKAELREQKMLAKTTPLQAGTPRVKPKKDRKMVFVSTVDTAKEALELAGISYEGELNIKEIEFCKVEALQECIFGNLHIPMLNKVLGEKIKMFFFVNRRNIVIIDDHGFAEKIIRRIISSRIKPGLSRERFLYNFCIKFMDKDLENLGRYSKKIMKIEEEVSEGNLDEVTETIAQLRKELLVLREYYDELRDLGKQLEENENRFFSGKNLEYFGIISDRADRLMGRTMYLLDYIGQVRETYQGIVAEQQNDNMRFLTIISTIFYPLTLITGWYGMNFQNMPELKEGYPFVIVFSLLVVAIIFNICKKKNIF